MGGADLKLPGGGGGVGGGIGDLGGGSAGGLGGGLGGSGLAGSGLGGGSGTGAAGLPGLGKVPTGTGTGSMDPRDPNYPYPRPPDSRFPDPNDPNKFPVPGEPGYPDPRDPNPGKFPDQYVPDPTAGGGYPGGGDYSGGGGGVPGGGGGVPGGGVPGGGGGGYPGGGDGWNQNQVVQATPEMLQRESQLWGDTASEVKQAVQRRVDNDDTNSVDFGMMRDGYPPYADLVARLQKWSKDAGVEFDHISRALASASNSYREVDDANVAATKTINL